MNKLRKIIPHFSFHYVAYTLMFFVVVFSVVHLVSATTPNPGHPWIEVGDGNIIFADPGAGPFTYTLPSANTTILTTNALVTVGQGGTGANTFASNGVLYGNGSGAIQALAVNAGATQCLTQASSAAPAWGSCGSSYTFSTGLTNSSGTITANLSTGVSGGQSAIGGTAAGNNLTLSSTTNGTKGKIIFGSLSAYDEVNDRFGIGQTSPSARLDIKTDSLGTTQTASSGISLVNTTAAAAGAQQISPAVIWTGQGWKTNATAASQSVAFRSYVLPAQGAANPTGAWLLESSINGAAYVTRMSVGTSDAADLIKIGDVAGGTNLVSISSTGVTLNGSGGVSLNAPNVIFTSNGSDERLNFNTSAGTYGIGDLSVADNGSVFYLDDTGSIAYYDKTSHNGSFGINTSTPAAALDVVGNAQITTQSATAFTVARLGTNYALQVDTNTASSATGLKVTSAAAGGGLALSTISTGTDESITIDAKGAGTVGIGGTSTGNILLGGGSGSTGCTVTNSNGNFACTGTGTFSNFSGTNTGDVTLGSFGSSPNANGASLSGQALTLQPADGSNPGGVSTTTQTFGGNKTFSGNTAFTGSQSTTLQSTTALTVARSGTDYAFQVDTNTASSVTGLKITSAAANTGLALSVISTSANEALAVDAKGSGNITIGSSSTGSVFLAGGQTSTGCSILNSTGAILCSGGGTFGLNGGSSGSISLLGSTSGTISINSQATAGTYNFNLPTTAGSSSQVLTSAGGGASPMTWTTLDSIATTGLTNGSGTTASGTAVNLGGSTTTSTLIEIGGDSFEISSSSKPAGLFIDGNSYITQIGDVNLVTGSNIFTVDDANSFAYYDNIGHNGKFGINTVTPATELDVVGTLQVSTLATGGSNECVQVGSTGILSKTGSACGSGGGLTVGTTTISSGTASRVLFEGAGNVLAEDADFTFSTDTLTVTKIAATTFTGNITTSAVNIITDTTTGTKIGTSTLQKLGFFNATPVVQQTGNVLTALQNLGLVASATLPASSVSSGAALTKTDDTNVTLTLGGSPSTALLAASSLTLGWTGQLSVARGGTNCSAASITCFNNITGYTAAGATGTTSTNLVFSTSPTITTPTFNTSATLAAGANLVFTSGAGQIQQTFTTASAVDASAFSYTLTNSGAGVSIGGLALTPVNNTNPSSGTNTLNVINFAAGTNGNDADNTTNGINFASATGYKNFLNSPSIVINSSGAISGATGVGTTTVTASGQITSTVSTGTAPFVVASTTNVANLNASSLNGATFASPGSIGSGTPGSGAFTTLTSSGNTTLATGSSTTNTFGSGASSINTIGSSTTPGALTLHGATTLDNTFTVSGSNLTSLGGNLTVTGTSWTATPTISGLITATSGLTSNGTLTVSANQNLTMSSGTGVFSQTYANTAAGSAETKSVTNNNSSASSIIVNGYDITQVNGTNVNNTNTNNGINFNAATNTNSNTINGINFASATGYTNFLKTPSVAITSAGAITGATGFNGLVITANTGTVTTGTWNGSVIGATYGGTGVNNGSNTITLGGNISTAGALTTSGAFGITLTATGTTSVTLPTSGTLVSSVTTANGVSASNSGGALTFTLGAITPSTVNGLTLTANATGFSVAGGTTSKTLTVSNSLTLAGTDGTTMTFPSTSATIARTDAGQTFTGVQTFASAPTFSSITGSTQCLQVNSSGVVSGTGSGCGGSGGLTVGTTAISSGTANRILFENGSNVLSESANLTYDGTTLAVATSSTTASNKALNISQTGATSGTDYAGYFSNTGAATANVGLYATASGGTANYAGIFDAGKVLFGLTSETTTDSKIYLQASNNNASGGATAAVAGIFEDLTFNPSGGGTQVGNRMIISNAPTTSANTSIGQIIRTTDNTTLANTVRGIEIVSSVGSNTNGTNTGLRATGATFGVQGITTGLAGGVSAPAALYGEMQGTTQGDALRLYSTTITSSPAMATFYQDTSVFSGAGILMDFGSATSDTFTGKFLDLKNDDDTKFYVDANGKISLTLDGTASTAAICGSQGTGTSGDQADIVLRDCSGAPAADYAEMYPVSLDTEYGDIVMTGTDMVNTYDTTNGNIDWNKIKGKITKLVKSNAYYQNNVIGIVVDNHGDFTSSGYNLKESDNPMPVALNGRVPVKISSNSPDIMPGDYLTTSTDPGKATKATRAGAVIGKALGVWTRASGDKTVMVYVEQGFYNGQGVSQFAGIDPMSSDFSKLALKKFMQSTNDMYLNSEVLAGRISAGLEVITPKLVADNVSTNTINSSTGENIGLVISGTGKFVIGANKTTNPDGTSTVSNPVITFDNLGNAVFAGKITAKEIQVGDLSGIQDITNQINQLAQGQQAFNLTAQAMNALSGALTVAQSDIENIKGKINNINQKVDGLTILGSELDNRLKSIEAIFTSNTFNNILSLSTTALAVGGDAQFNGNSVFNGGVEFGNQTEFSVPPLFNKNSAGYAIVKEGDRRVRVAFDQAYIATPVVNTSITFESNDNIDDSTAGQLFASDIRFIIVSKDQTGFTILLNKNAPRDVRFSWNALAVKDPQIFESVFEGLTIEQPQTVTDNNTNNTDTTPTGDNNGETDQNNTSENQDNETTDSGSSSTGNSTTPENNTTPSDGTATSGNTTQV